MKDIYIVTGANGFLGNNIVRLLEKKNVEIRTLVFHNDKIESFNGLNCQIYTGNVTDIDSLKAIFDVPKNVNLYVIHCAGVVYIKSKYNDNVYNVNVNGTKNIVKKCLETNGKLIYISSVHGIPEKDNNEVITEVDNFDVDRVKGLYAKTKAEAGNYILKNVKTNGLNACIVHPSGIIGPNDYGNSHLTEFVRNLVSGSLPVIVDGGFDFVDVRDVASGVVNACILGKPGKCYILSNEYYSVKELVSISNEIMGTNKKRLMLPISIAKLFAYAAEVYYNIRKQTPLFTAYSLDTLKSNANFSNKLANDELNYQTRDMKETLKDTIKWLENYNKK